MLPCRLDNSRTVNMRAIYHHPLSHPRIKTAAQELRLILSCHTPVLQLYSTRECNMLRHELGLGTWEGTPLSMSSFPCSLVGVPKLRPVWAVPSPFDEHLQ